MITRILTAIVFLVLSTAAQARCLPQTDMSPQGECGKPWPKGDRLAQNFPTPAGNSPGTWGYEIAHPRSVSKHDQAISKCFRTSPHWSGRKHDEWLDICLRDVAIEDFYASDCFRTGMPKECNGWVGGPYGWTKP